MADKDYEVGYGRPPRATRFRPGKSGNPKGRPRAAKNFATALEQELRALLTITENGKRKRVPVRQIIIKRLVRNAAEGELRAILLLVQQEARFEQPEAMPDRLTNEEDHAVIEGIRERMRPQAPPPPADNPPMPTGDDDVDGGCPTADGAEQS